MTIPGVGDSASTDQRRPGPLLDHPRRRLAQRVRWTDRQRHLRHPVPHLHLRPPLANIELVRIASRLPQSRRPTRTLSGRPRHIDSAPASRRMQTPPQPIRPLLALVALGATVVVAPAAARPPPTRRAAASSSSRSAAPATRWRRPAPRPQSAPTSTTPSPRPAKSARTATRSKGSSSPGREPAARQRQPGRLDAGRPRQRPGPRRHRRLRRRCRPACPARHRPKVPGGPGAQVFANNGCGGCHTLAGRRTRGRRHRPRPRRSACPGDSAAEDQRRRSSTPTPKSRRRLPANVMPPNFGETISAEEELEQLVEFLVENRPRERRMST